jgi:hypothetical protein
VGAGLRNRNLAPLYALSISFVIVLTLGLIHPDNTNGPKPTSPKTTGKPKTLTIVLDKDSAPLKSAIILWGKEKVAISSPDDLGAITPDGPITVCAPVSTEHIPKGKAITTIGDLSCWGPLEPDDKGKITIKVER